ncbi:2-oxoglutarate dehydrogenase complex dihydrolipoyllysine-residue succinyltransferase [Candidatus Bodocaedibacter vickermanii]|uniref:Dihydrolipoyllysine-residue succinyltransferase component of 2-oxoglutarate dehydrogenase complex n=1 Tax=Candidatus Bodocaedibacter vickermanii TaxID=2741701 RepID=A0A7L9RTY2_9PROT|nr:Dihydrolipoyllysine-residue succinyltransferase component of 2-oxoglutarate dehydrogenase complex [Candidatus Paracaedibacteraceae bacterium 'Lake Konstanz']
MKDILVPILGESVTEATVGKWYINAGESIEQDGLLVELETDKVTLEVNAPVSGTLKEIAFPKGSIVNLGDILGRMEEGSEIPKTTSQQPVKNPEPAALPAENPPSVKKMLAENNLSASAIPSSGKDGRLTKTDVLQFVAPPSKTSANRPKTNDREERVTMSRLRKKIAERLKNAQNTAAILTTFNEIDMSHVMDLRKRLQESFQASHGVKLGFMSFFLKACVQALKEIPALNAEIDGTDIVFKHYYDLGVAVSTDRGLVVPVVRNVDELTFADIEKAISDLGTRAKDGKLEISELNGGTFSITNGGTFGSLMSTPIINPPQCGILGMHAIQNRPVAIGDKVEIRPMMYVALSYDHRLVDGKEAVTFLVRIKQMLEDPERLLLNV